MVEADLRRGHQSGRESRNPRVPRQLLDLGNFVPAAEVLNESARVIGPTGHLCQQAWRGQHRIYSVDGDGDLSGVQDRAQACDAVPGEGRHHAIGEHRSYDHHSGPLAVASSGPITAMEGPDI